MIDYSDSVIAIDCLIYLVYLDPDGLRLEWEPENGRITK